MPNWTYNVLTIKALKNDRIELDRFILAAMSKREGNYNCPMDFECFIPYPHEWREFDKKINDPNASFNLDNKEYAKQAKELGIPAVIDGCKNGYDWTCKHWGTKWNARSPEVDLSNNGKGKIVYTFDTAWSPPIPILFKMSELFPKLKFNVKIRYEGEAGTDTLKLQNGKQIK